MGKLSLSVAPFDPRYAQSQGPTTQFAETCPRWAVNNTSIPIAGTVYLRRVTLQPGTFTTVSIVVSTAAASLANCFVGLYNTTSLVKSAATADVSATIGTNTGVVALTLSSSLVNTAVQDYYVGFLAGGGTPPTLAVHGSGNSVMLTNGLAPTMADKHNTTGLTALPDPVVLANAASAVAPACFYARLA